MNQLSFIGFSVVKIGVGVQESLSSLEQEINNSIVNRNNSFFILLLFLIKSLNQK